MWNDDDNGMKILLSFFFGHTFVARGLFYDVSYYPI